MVGRSDGSHRDETDGGSFEGCDRSEAVREAEVAERRYHLGHTKFRNGSKLLGRVSLLYHTYVSAVFVDARPLFSHFTPRSLLPLARLKLSPRQ